MAPSPQLADSFQSLRPLIVNDRVSQAFDRHERAARRWKRMHSTLGRLALVCISLVMLFFDFEFTLGHIFPVPQILSRCVAAIAALGIFAQLALVFFRIKERWILERFAAERLRCLKFQAFAFIPLVPDPAALESAVAVFVDKQIALLHQELMAGRRAIDNFSPSDVAIPSESERQRGNTPSVAEAFTLYKSIRLDVQEQHFSGQAHLSDERGRYPALFSEMAFVVGATLAIIHVIAAALNPTLLSDNGRLEIWLSFFTMGSFIVSAVLAVYQRGSADAAHAERYKHYAREIHGLRMRIVPTSADSFSQTVKEMELLELRELFDFCRDSMRSSYIF
ncbi:MAG TPA: hypothetical protein VHY79_19895 [Rhizomicrobium sp.]|jgi:hypothetical protein|nr:hypothetical protein [Rhizomicrobium sp.]